MSEKDCKVFLYALCSLVLLAGLGIAQEAKPVPEASQNKLLKAQHAVDDLTTKETNMRFNFTTAQQTIKDVQAQFPVVEGQLQEALKSLDSANTEATKAAGLDPAKFVPDVNTMKFVAKPPAPPAPEAPAKK